MLLNLSLVFAICYFIEITKTHNLPKISNKKYAVAKNREELISIIRSLKYYQDELNNINESDTDLTDEEKEKKLQNLLWLIKKNYKAQKDFDFLHNNRFHTTSRLHLIKNPLVLEEYKNHLKKIRRLGIFIERGIQNKLPKNNYQWCRFPKTNLTKSSNQLYNLKNKLRNMRRDAAFRLGSSDSYSEDIDKKEEKETLTVRNSIQPYNPVKKTQKKEEAQVLKKDIFIEYPETKDTLELHNTNVHNSLRSDYDFRREKSKWDERFENSNNVEEDRKIKNTYRNQPSLKNKKNRIESENVNWDKITTKDYSIMYNKKKTTKEYDYNKKESDYKIKPSYKKPKNDNMNKDFYSYGRTPIPYVGKRGIYDEK